MTMAIIRAGLGLAFVALAACASEGEEPRLADDQSASGETTTTTADADTTTTTTAPERDEFVVGDRVETALGNFLQVFSYEQPVPPPDEFSVSEPGHEFAVIDIETCVSNEDDTGLRSENPFNYELQMPDNTRVQADIPVREPALNDTALPHKGDCVRGFVTFQVPAGQRPVFIEHIFTDPKVRWMVPA